MNSNHASSRTYARRIGIGLAVGAFVLYAGTLSTGFLPGPMTSLVAGYLGASPFPATMHHLWGAIVWLVAQIPVGGLAVRIHLLNAVLAALSIGLLYSIVYRIKPLPAFTHGMPSALAERTQLFTAIAAALILAISVPFWIAATRAHPLMLSLALMLLAFDLLLRYGEDGKPWRLNTATLAYALGMGNFASLVLYLPIFIFLILIFTYRHGALTWKRFFGLAGIGLLGAIPLIVAGLLYMQSPAYEWREFKHYWHVLRMMLVDQYHFVLKSVPRVGWLTVFVGSMLPWFAVYAMGVGRRSLSAGTWLGTALLCLLMLGLSIVWLLDLKISPWVMTGDRPLLVTPYVFFAMWTASVTGYWMGFIQRFGPAGRKAGAIWAVAVLVFLGVVGTRNYAVASGNVGRHFANYARAMADRLEPYPYVISTGYFDDLIALEFFDRKKDTAIINIRQAASKAYRRYIATLFEDPRLKNLVEINIQPFVMEWFSKEKNLGERLAVLDMPEMWMAAQRIAEPHGPVYVGRLPDEPLRIEEIAADNRAFWREFPEQAASLRFPDRHPDAYAVRVLLAQSAKAANNYGVLMEEQERPDLAEEAYRAAQRFDTNNISSLVNLYALLQRQGRDEADELRARIESLISAENIRRYLWSLSYHQGFIRSPELYASRGWAWAMSGKPALAAENIRQAIDLGGDTAALRIALTALDAGQEGPQSPEEVLQAELDRDPSNVQVAMQLYQLALRRGQFDVARGRLDLLRGMNVPADAIRIEEALLEALSGNIERAAAMLADEVRRSPENLRAWAILAVVAGDRGDSKTVRDALEKLEQARRVSPSVRFIAAQAALREGDRAGARRQLEQALRQEPGHVPSIELMIRVLMSEGDRQGAENMLERLISVSPRHPFGNYLMGAIQALRGQYELAESYYRVSLEAIRSPEALNDLAYVLTRQNRVSEALPLIEECLQKTDIGGAVWSTYGYVLMTAGRYAEAEEALKKAVAVHPDNAEVQFNLALLYEKTGRKAEARELAESLTSRSGELLRDDQEGLRALLNRLRSGS